MEKEYSFGEALAKHLQLNACLSSILTIEHTTGKKLSIQERQEIYNRSAELMEKDIFPSIIADLEKKGEAQ